VAWCEAMVGFIFEPALGYLVTNAHLLYYNTYHLWQSPIVDIRQKKVTPSRTSCWGKSIPFSSKFDIGGGESGSGLLGGIKN